MVISAMLESEAAVKKPKVEDVGESNAERTSLREAEPMLRF